MVIAVALDRYAIGAAAIESGCVARFGFGGSPAWPFDRLDTFSGQ
jgi:hypothetical protein